MIIKYQWIKINKNRPLVDVLDALLDIYRSVFQNYQAAEEQICDCKQNTSFSLHFAFQRTSENEEFGNGLGFGRKYAILTHFCIILTVK